MTNFSWQIYAHIFLWFILIFVAGVSRGYTNPADVTAINNLYAALGSPLLPGWVPVGGDPCADAWQGVQCDNSNISSIIFNAANLGGELGDNLGSFASIKVIDLSNNQIEGSIPSNLPVTMQQLFLSDNKFTGSIPSSLSSLSQLSAMSLNYNQLTGDIPDIFQGLTVLVNLDLSNNNLSGQLPPSLESVSSLTTLRLQNNQLSGTLDVLQELPLTDLNVENNKFSGPIPEKLLKIPKFKADGNPFNTSVAPIPPPTSPSTWPHAPPFFGVPTSGQTPGKQTPGKETPSKPGDGRSTTEDSNSERTKKTSSTKKIVWISIAVVLFFVILVLVLLLFIPRYCRGTHDSDRISKWHEIAPYMGNKENLRDNGSLVQPVDQIEKVPKVAVVKSKEEHQTVPRAMGLIPMPRKEELNVKRMSSIPKLEDHEIDMTRFVIDSMVLPPPPPPPPSTPPPAPYLPFEKVIVKPNVPAEVIPMKSSARPLPPTSVKSYTIASLQ